MAQVRKILIADPDLESVRAALARAARRRATRCTTRRMARGRWRSACCATRTSSLFDEACRLLDARTFIQILRTNPRTEDIPVVLTTTSCDADRLRGLRDGYLRKPFNLDEVL